MIATGAMLATTGGAAIGAPHTRATLIATPKLSVTITTTGHGQSATSSMAISGPRTVSAGRVAISLHAVGGEAEVGVAKIKKGHTFKEAAGLFGAFESSFGPMGPTKAGLRGLNNLVRIVTFYGGIDSGSFRRVHGTVVLPKAGTYLLLNDENGPSQPHKLKVTPQVGVRLAPNSTGVVKTRNSKRFAGSSTLPAHGTITFENRATNSPHLLVLQHVKKGTTRTQMIKFLNSPAGESGQPSFGLRESVATDVLSSGQSQTISYHMPAGEYVEMCYFPDLQTGMPHALMGMVRVVHLK
jgi:hypothetical protein